MAGPKKLLPQLYLYDQESDRQSELLIAKYRYNITKDARVKPVKDLRDLAAKINSEQQIGHLVLSFHGFGGGIIVGKHAYNLDDSKVKSTLTSTRRGSVPSVERINFFGCNIGLKPSRLKSFAGIYGARRASAYTWFIVHQKISLTIPKGNTVQDVEKTLENYEAYILGTPDPAGLAARAGAKDAQVPLILVYGSKDGSTAKFPIGFGQKRNFQPLSQAKKTEIKAANVAKADTEYDAPVVFFEYVTVVMK